MESLFRRTYQSKTNCCCLHGGKNLLYARDLQKTALKGFLPVLNFHTSLAASQEQTFFQKHHLANGHSVFLGQNLRPAHCISWWKGGRSCAGIVGKKRWSRRLFDVNFWYELSFPSSVSEWRQEAKFGDSWRCVLCLSSELLRVELAATFLLSKYNHSISPYYL